MTQGIGQYVTVLQIKAHLSALTTSDDAILEDICEGVNQWMEGRLGRSFAKDTAASYLFDGYTAYTSRNDFGLWLKAPNVLPIPNGIQAISLRLKPSFAISMVAPVRCGLTMSPSAGAALPLIIINRF